MDKKVEQILSRVRDTADFADVKFSDVNDHCSDGDNALHVVVRWGNLADAKILIDAGIDINKAGDLGYTPLHLACMKGNYEMVVLLFESGADLFALSEGDAPFGTARIAGFDKICDFLGPLMERQQSLNSKVWIKARIDRLRQEIAILESEMNKT